MPRGPVVYSLPPGTTPQQPNTTIQSEVHNNAFDDIEQTFNTPTPVEYGGTGATNIAAARTNLGVAGADVGGINYIINPLGFINQRGYVSGAATTVANQYTVDRYRVVTVGQNVSWFDAANVRIFTCPAGGFEQVIEGLSLASGNYTLSWSGTATATVNGVSAASGSVVAVTGGVNQVIRWIAGTMSMPQFNKGTAIAAFSPPPVQQDLAQCQRYCQLVEVQAQLQAGSAGALLQLAMPLQVQMRTFPSSVVFLSGTSNNASSILLFLTQRSAILQMTSIASGPTGVFNRTYLLTAEL